MQGIFASNPAITFPKCCPREISHFPISRATGKPRATTKPRSFGEPSVTKKPLRALGSRAGAEREEIKIPGMQDMGLFFSFFPLFFKERGSKVLELRRRALGNLSRAAGRWVFCSGPLGAEHPAPRSASCRTWEGDPALLPCGFPLP